MKNKTYIIVSNEKMYLTDLDSTNGTNVLKKATLVSTKRFHLASKFARYALNALC